MCLFTVLELYLFCECLSNGLHHSRVSIVAVHSCQNDVENSIIKPMHAVVLLFSFVR